MSLGTAVDSSASLQFSQLILSGTSDSPGVRHFSSLAPFHTHIRASALSRSHAHCLAPCLTLSFTEEGFQVMFSGVFGCSDDWSCSGYCPAKRCTFKFPRRGLVSAGGGACQGVLHFVAGQSVPLHYLLDVLLFFPLQDAQEVLQLGHGESMPL